MRATERATLVSSIVSRLPADERTAVLHQLFAATDAPAAAQILAGLVRRVFVVRRRRAWLAACLSAAADLGGGVPVAC